MIIFRSKILACYQRWRVSLSKTKNSNRWEDDFRRIEFAGLFEEYLEMGSIDFLRIFLSIFAFRFLWKSFTIRIHHDIRRRFSISSAIRSVKQLDRNTFRRSQTCLRNEVLIDRCLFSTTKTDFRAELFSRRPIAFRAASIGIWFQILEVLSYLAIVGNVNLMTHQILFMNR